MKQILDEKFVRRAVISYLSRIGYNRYLKEKETAEHGVDIKVRHYRYARYFLVEVKGNPDPKKCKSPRSAIEVNFNYALGQIVSRMKYKALYKYGLGFSISYKEKVIKRLPWLLCKKLNLYVFIVDETGKVESFYWKNLKKLQ